MGCNIKTKPSTKRLWLVRHGEAKDIPTRGGSDLERALTKKGRRISKHVFAHLASSVPEPDMVISSQAVRARQTAELFAETFGVDVIQHTDELNPGGRFSTLNKLVKKAWKKADFVVLVGHEPDFSRAASRWIGARHDSIVLAKSGVIELEANTDKTVRLVMVLAPKIVD